MDCEKFDQHVIDALYDELDELTHAALKRHVEGCSRCAGIYNGLRATREVGILPVEEPSDDLEARILEAAASAQQRTPWSRRLLRGLAWAGSHAMRPQLAMAALFFLVIGSSLLLLRGRPGARTPVSVSGIGAPVADESPAAAPPPAAATAVAQATAVPAEGRAQPADSLAKEQAKEPAKAERAGADEARAALAEAHGYRSNCSVAVVKLDAVAVKFPGTQVAAEAMWEEAACYKQLGDPGRARQIYLALRQSGMRDRAERELADADNNSNMGNSQMAQRAAGAKAAAPAAPAAVAAAPAPAAAKPANEATGPAKAKRAGGGPGGKASPAPRKAMDAAGF